MKYGMNHACHNPPLSFGVPAIGSGKAILIVAFLLTGSFSGIVEYSIYDKAINLSPVLEELCLFTNPP